MICVITQRLILQYCNNIIMIDMILPNNTKGTVSNWSVGLVVKSGGRLRGMVSLLLTVEKLLWSTGLLVVANRTVGRALYQRHWHPWVSARTDHSHNRTSVTVNPRISARRFRFHVMRCDVMWCVCLWPARIHSARPE